jgi:hypothetical protein
MTEPLGPPPIEPLSDIEWSRVERGLWSRLDAAEPAATPARRWLPRWIWLAAPAIAAAAVLVVVVATGGDDAVIPPAETHARVVSNEAPSSISFGDAHVTLDPQSAIVMERDGGGAVVERGAAWFAVAPRKQRPFAVRAGDTTIRVIGTRFRVAHSAELVAVEVEHGVVEVQHRELMIELHAGQRWSSAEPTRTAQLDPAPKTAPDPVPDPAVELDPIPDDEPVMTGKTKKPPTKPVKPTVKAEPKPKPEVKLDNRARFERLAAMEARDPGGAITGYLAIASGTDAWAELSLFAAARLAHDRRDGRAKGLLERYLAKYPRGANADDARELLAVLKK